MRESLVPGATLPVRLKLTIQYDGTDFSGWQTQPGEVRTVQRTIERAIAAIEGERRAVHGAGRTDATTMISMDFFPPRAARHSRRNLDACAGAARLKANDAEASRLRRR